MPTSIGGIVWTGLSFPKTTVYLPIYFGIKDIPYNYNFADSSYDKNSAFWKFKRLSELVIQNFNKNYKYVSEVWDKVESTEFSLQSSIEKTAVNIMTIKPELCTDYLTKYCDDLSRKIIQQCDEMISELSE
jgi:dipeptidase